MPGPAHSLMHQQLSTIFFYYRGVIKNWDDAVHGRMNSGEAFDFGFGIAESLVPLPEIAAKIKTKFKKPSVLGGNIRCKRENQAALLYDENLPELPEEFITHLSISLKDLGTETLIQNSSTNPLDSGVSSSPISHDQLPSTGGVISSVNNYDSLNMGGISASNNDPLNMGGISGSLNNHDPLNMGGINVMNSNQSQTSSTPSPLNTTSEPIDFGQDSWFLPSSLNGHDQVILNNTVEIIYTVFLILKIMRIGHPKSKPFYDEICSNQTFPNIEIIDCQLTLFNALQKYENPENGNVTLSRHNIDIHTAVPEEKTHAQKITDIIMDTIDTLMFQMDIMASEDLFGIQLRHGFCIFFQHLYFECNKLLRDKMLKIKSLYILFESRQRFKRGTCKIGNNVRKNVKTKGKAPQNQPPHQNGGIPSHQPGNPQNQPSMNSHQNGGIPSHQPGNPQNQPSMNSHLNSGIPSHQPGNPQNQPSMNSHTNRGITSHQPGNPQTQPSMNSYPNSGIPSQQQIGPIPQHTLANKQPNKKKTPKTVIKPATKPKQTVQNGKVQFTFSYFVIFTRQLEF